MTILIIGRPDSGKSKIAEDMVMEMSAPGERIYLATMIPCGEEGRARIERHRDMRAGKGFVTIEAPFDLTDALDASAAAGPLPEAGHSASYPGDVNVSDPGSSTVLLECLSNLVANELFERQIDADVLPDRIADDISGLSAKVRNLVIVSNHFDIEAGFDADTVRYAETMDAVNDRISKMAGRTIHL